MTNYVTTGYAARTLGISTATLTRWVRQGHITPAEETRGGHFRWDMPVLRAQLRRLKMGVPDNEQIISEDIARIVHAAQREMQIVQGDPHASPDWDNAPDYQVRQCVAGVALVIAGATPEEAHEAWCARMRADGWIWGPRKDETGEFKTHPCLVPYADLTDAQRLKDVLLVSIVQGLMRRE